jgi:hypothetical protein
MADETPGSHAGAPVTNPVTGKELTPAAARALAEAAARRRHVGGGDRPAEVNGRDGPDPVRYGDWEVKGLASDF